MFVCVYLSADGSLVVNPFGCVDGCLYAVDASKGENVCIYMYIYTHMMYIGLRVRVRVRVRVNPNP